MPEDVKGPFGITPVYLRVEDPSKRLPRRLFDQLNPKGKGKRKKAEKEGAAPKSYGRKGQIVDVTV